MAGSDEWWKSIETGSLPLRTVAGTICQVFMGSMNDWPLFRILTSDGVATESITREQGFMKGEPYCVGRGVIWRYVEMNWKKPQPLLPGPDLFTVEIWMSELEYLFRPVGPDEMKLIVESGFAMFPPRLPEQPIFYPVTTYKYAEQIASKWNVRDSGRGYITRFAVDKAFLARYEMQQAGSREYQEYWIPAEHLAEFNGHIVGKIEVVASFP